MPEGRLVGGAMPGPTLEVHAAIGSAARATGADATRIAALPHRVSASTKHLIGGTRYESRVRAWGWAWAKARRPAMRPASRSRTGWVTAMATASVAVGNRDSRA